MADATSNGSVGRLKSTPNIHWAAGLVVSTVLSFLFALVVIAIDNAWVLLILGGLLLLVLAAAVGFTVRLTTANGGYGAFWAALVTAGLGVHVVTTLAGAGFDFFGEKLLGTYGSSPLSAFVVFFGLIAALVATVGRR